MKLGFKDLIIPHSRGKEFSMNTYQLLDSGHFRKLEKIGSFLISRPAASAVWDPALPLSEWQGVDAEFLRHSEGTGEWRVKNRAVETPFMIDVDGLKFQIKLTSFGHLGIFPEQRAHWRKLENQVRERADRGLKTRVLNLFAYTGGATMACVRAGAEVAHVDASKGTVRWASENAAATGLGEKSIRWLVDDVQAFVARELRRESRYEGLILDPPSYGKGDKKQVWKIENDLLPLLKNLKKIFSPTTRSFVCLSAHSEGYSPISLENQLVGVFGKESLVESEEMVIPDAQGRLLPSGAGALLKIK